MSLVYRRRIRQFREILDLRKLDRPGDPKQGVVATWPDPTSLVDPGWETVFDNTWYQDGGAMREWVMRRESTTEENRGQERIALKIYVASRGVLPAWRHFVREAISPTLPLEELGYERRLEGEVATLALRAPIPETQRHEDSVLQLYRNVVFDVRSYDTDVDVVAVAERLRQTAQQHSDEKLGEHPTLAVEPEPGNQAAVGAEMKVDLPAAPDDFGSFERTGFEVQVQTRGKAVEFVGFRGSEARFRMLQPGRGRIRVQAIDRRSLASQEVLLDLNVE